MDLLIHIPAGSAYGLLIPLGYRDELIGLLRVLLKKRFGSRGVHTVTLSVGKQSSRIRPWGAAGGDCTVNIFPYAAPLAVRVRLLGKVGLVQTRTHSVCITRTAHPGLCLAARQAGLKVIAYLDGVSAHCAGHGLTLLKKLLTASKMKAA